MDIEAWQKDLYEETLTDGIMRMGTLASHLLNKRVNELQDDAFAQGIEEQRKRLNEWIQKKRLKIAESPNGTPEFTCGERQVLMELSKVLSRPFNVN